MFLDLGGSSNKQKKREEKLTISLWSQKWWLVLASESANNFKQIIVFVYLNTQKISLDDPDARTSHPIKILRQYFDSQVFFLLFSFFCCGNPWMSIAIIKFCVNILIYILNLFSKVSGGLRATVISYTGHLGYGWQECSSNSSLFANSSRIVHE